MTKAIHRDNEPRQQRRQQPIAIVGVGGLFPGALDVASFWRNILAGADLTTEIPDSHWRIEHYYDPNPVAPDKTYCKRGAFLPEVSFDPLEFGMPPKLLSSTDTSQLLGLLVARTTLNDATHGRFAELDNSRVSVLLGVTSGQELFGQMASRLQQPAWRAGMRAAGVTEGQVEQAVKNISDSFVPWTEASFPGLLGNVVAGRIANRLNLGGTNAVTDAACASSFAALAMAIDELVLERADMVLTGGVDTLNDIFMYMCFSKTPALSAQGECRPFDAEADGTLLGEGLGMLALKRLVDAERDGNPIYAIIRGLGSSSDGRSKSVYAPVSEGQARALARAYQAAGYSPGTVELVEAHGTGTKAGDIAELGGLKQVFEGSGRGDHQWCALGSVKSQIGHTKAAAGAAGLLKIALALHHQVLPPTIKVTRPNPQADFPNSPFYINSESRPWIRAGDHPRRASVSSFGFGGSNFHITLEEYTGSGARPPRLMQRPAELFCFAAISHAGLTARCRELRSRLDMHSLQTLARASQAEFDIKSDARLTFVAGSREQLEARIDAALAALASNKPVPGLYLGEGPSIGKLAFLFPGQGSQYVNMGRDAALMFPTVRAALDAADNIPLAGHSLSRMLFPPPAFDDDDRRRQQHELTRTEWAQPALGAISAALLAFLKTLNIAPEMAAGHSFGELVALHAAGVFDLATLLKLARRRGELMAAASEQPGAMVAVTGSVSKLRELLIDTDIVLANHNAPDQAVISGAAQAVTDFSEKLAAQDFRLQPLNVATAFHSPLVAAAGDAFKAVLDTTDFRTTQIPVYANVSAAPYPNDALAKTLLADQIGSEVRFVETIDALYRDGARTFVEVGPGNVLSTLVGRILDGRPHRAIATDRRGHDGAACILEALAQLLAAGVDMDLTALWKDYPATPEATPSARSALSIPINGANIGKPKLPAAAPLPPPPTAIAPTKHVPTERISTERKPFAMTNDFKPRTPRPTTASVIHSQDNGWLEVFREGQRQTADAHAAFQQAMADAHRAFLQTAQHSTEQLAALVSGVAPNAKALPEQALEHPARTAPPQAVTLTAPEPVQTQAEMPRPIPEAEPITIPDAKPEVAAAGSAAVDLDAVLLDVVADKTGYPVEALAPDMNLEADLGIDSIKRVEILSALRERLPAATEVDAMALAQLSTLGDITAYLQDAWHPRQTDPTPPPPTPASAVAEADIPTAAAPPSDDLNAVLFNIVADKTGYPVEALAPDMSLEADLGIDSIKRVEILSALRERFPATAEVDAMELARLATLGEIGAALGAGSASTPQPQATPQATPQAAPPAAAAPRAPFVQRGELVLTPATPGQTRLRLAPGARIALLPDRDGVAAELQTLLQVRGFEAILWQTNGTHPPTAGFSGLINLRGLSHPSHEEEALLTLRQAFAAAKDFAPTLRAAGREDGACFITVQALDGRFGLSGVEPARALLGGLAALAKTAAQEWPEVAAKAIDIHSSGLTPQQIAAQLLDEILNGCAEIEVGIDGDQRLTPAINQASLNGAARPLLEPEAVVVATGGARGITAAALERLASALPLRLVLLGRTDIDTPAPPETDGAADESALKRVLFDTAQARGETLSPATIGERAAAILAAREIRAQLQHFKNLGAEVLYLAVDVRDETALAQALAQARATFGPIDALIHGAGVLADKRIEDKSLAQFDTVLATKVRGLLALLKATRDDPIKMLHIFSSAAARYGNIGQADYAMANEALNKLAYAEQQRRGNSCMVKALGWGPWETGMVTPALKQQFESRGVALLSLERGAQLFVEETSAAAAGGCPEVVFGGPLNDSSIINERLHAGA